MIEYRFKASQYDRLDELNEYMPNDKVFKIDKYTGEAWIKITNEEHTQSLEVIVRYFCKFSYYKKDLKISNSSDANNTLPFTDDRDTLF